MVCSESFELFNMFMKAVVIVLAARQERLNLPSGMCYFHRGARRFGILVTHHEPGLKEVQAQARQGVCHLQSGSRLQV